MTPEESKEYHRAASRRHYELHLPEIQAKREANREKARLYVKEYRLRNPDLAKAASEKHYRSAKGQATRKRYSQRPEVKAKHCAEVCAYIAANKEKVYERRRKWKERTQWNRAYHAHRWATDPIYKLKMVLRSRLRDIVKAGSITKATRELIGCDLVTLRQHLESQFRPGMTWDNWTQSGWHIDHIKPLASFNLEDPAQLAMACNYTNLQPLWAIENLRKGARLP